MENDKKLDNTTYDKIITFNNELLKQPKQIRWNHSSIINDMLQNFNDENYLFLEGDNNINSVFVNNKLIQDSGNIEQLGSRGATELSKGDSVSGQPSGSIRMYGNAGVVKVGSNIITIDGVSASEPSISWIIWKT